MWVIESGRQGNVAHTTAFGLSSTSISNVCFKLPRKGVLTGAQWYRVCWEQRTAAESSAFAHQSKSHGLEQDYVPTLPCQHLLLVMLPALCMCLYQNLWPYTSCMTPTPKKPSLLFVIVSMTKGWNLATMDNVSPLVSDISSSSNSEMGATPRQRNRNLGSCFSFLPFISNCEVITHLSWQIQESWESPSSSSSSRTQTHPRNQLKQSSPFSRQLSKPHSSAEQPHFTLEGQNICFIQWITAQTNNCIGMLCTLSSSHLCGTIKIQADRAFKQDRSETATWKRRLSRGMNETLPLN